MTAERRCPICGRRLVPVVIGEPTPDTMEAAKRGEVVIGGCLKWTDDDQFECPRGHGFILRGDRLVPYPANAQVGDLQPDRELEDEFFRGFSELRSEQQEES